MSNFEVIVSKDISKNETNHTYYLDVLDEVLLWMEQFATDDEEGKGAVLNMSALLEVKNYIKRWQIVKERNAEDVAKRLSKALFDSQG